VCIGLKTAQL